MRALQYIASELPNIRIVDPANTNNVASDELTRAEKSLVAASAAASSRAKTWEEILW